MAAAGGSKAPSGLQAMKGKLKQGLKIPGRKKCQKTPNTSHCTEEHYSKEVVLNFVEYLSQNHFEEATQHLNSQEEQLFGQKQTGAEVDTQPSNQEDEENKLHIDYETLRFQTWMAVHNTFSFSPSGENMEVLRRAVASIMQQEEQDRRWKKQPEGLGVPEWRPLRCRSTHDSLLQMMVESRLKNAATQEDIDGVDNLSTDMKREVCKMGIRLKEDLLVVVRDVKGCYPEELDICNLYAGIYHQTFSAKLTELARSGLDLNDCIYLLSWINNYYPNTVLNETEVRQNISCDSMGGLIPEADLAVLEEQYLAHKEAEVKTWLGSALKNEVESWQEGKIPELIDGYLFCPLAIDVIQLINSAMTESMSILGNKRKCQRILWQLESFLISYKTSLDDFIKERQTNTQDILKANLVSVEQIWDFIVRGEDSVPEEAKEKCLLALTSLKDSGFRYFIGSLHVELKVQYKKLWTQDWLTGNQNILDNILETLSNNLQLSTNLMKPECIKELLGRLHTDVMVEYVKRMMKRNMKLRDSEQQKIAIKLLCEDNERLSTFFMEGGSNESWLCEILPKLAEVLKQQDPGYVELEILTLARDYPDLRSNHVSALLFLKGNLSKAEMRPIKESLEKYQPAITSPKDTRVFFSKVTVQKSPWRVGII